MGFRDTYLDIRCPTVPVETIYLQQGRLRDGEHGREIVLQVTRTTPIVIKRAVEKLARYFRREFEYDFSNYTVDEHTDACGAWLWIDRTYGERWPATGHAVFWRAEDGNWDLGSVWQHPYRRDQGRLRAIWPTWQQIYGPFWIATPLSSAMRGFLMNSDTVLPNGKTMPEWLS